jgi:DNA-binding response OmpR family regulator
VGEMGKKKWILVVDDDKAIRESLERILEMESYKVDTSETGKEALEKLWARHYHLVIIDSRLPDMTSEELKRKIEIIWSYIRVLVLGMKPIIPKKLLKIIETKLKS